MKTTVLAMLSVLALALVAAPGVAAESVESSDDPSADQGCIGYSYEDHPILGSGCIGWQYQTGSLDTRAGA